MSRLLFSSREKPPTTAKPISSQYKLFVWDVGTDSRPTSEASIRTIAAVEFWSPASDVAHFSTAVRSLAATTTKKHTPTFPDAWSSFSSFIADHSEGKPALLVSHNAAFDVTVLLNELQRANITIPSTWRFACSLLLARSAHPYNTDNSQLALALKFGITIDRPHHTPEDVTVLRQILIALDQKAIKLGTPSNRVVTALANQAQKPAFFDRTPELATSDEGIVPKYFITQTGMKYHRERCKWLHRSSIPRQTPPPGFKPCRQCRPDDIHFIPSDKYSREKGANSHLSDNPTSARNSQVFVTKSGSNYHVEGCKWLRKSKIPRDSPPDGFKPCGTCIRERISCKSVRTKNDSTSLAEEGCEQRSLEKAPYYITKSGSKYHVGTCPSLSRSRIPKNKVPSGYDACGRCLPDVAYSGSPKLKRVPL